VPIINQMIYLQAYLASGMAESPCQNVLWHHQSMSQNTYSISPHSHLSPGNLWALHPCVVSWELVHHLLPCWLSSLLSSSLLSSSSSLLFSWLSSPLHPLPSWFFCLPSSWPFPLSSLLFLLLFAFIFVLSWLSSHLVPFSSAVTVLWPAVFGIPFPQVGPNTLHW